MHFIRWSAAAFVLAFVLLSAWRGRDSALLRPLIGTPEPPTRAIRFDNGTVRQLGAASDVASAVAEPLPLPPGGMRKCVKRSEVIYTDRTCPQGMKEQDIDKSRFNTVEAHR